jgi:HlyD family secretion protein
MVRMSDTTWNPLMRRTILVVLGLMALTAGLAAANLRRDPGSRQIDWRLIKLPPHEVSVESPSRGEIVQTVTAPGKIEPVEEADIASQIVGRAIAVNIKDGDIVKKGDILVRLDQTDARAQLDSSLARIDRYKAAIAQAEADREKAERDLARFDNLAGRGVASKTEVADARSLLAKARAALQISKNELLDSEAQRRTSQQYLDRTEIRSPIDGVVAGLNVEVGEVVIAGTTNLPGTVMMTVGNLSQMRARADVDETDVPLVRPGQLARVYLQSNLTAPIPGNVDRVAPKGKKTDEVVSFETLVNVGSGGESVRSGMTSTVEIEVRRVQNALGVPVQAVVHRRRKDLPNTAAVRHWSDRHAKLPGEKARDAEARYVKLVFVLEGGVARAKPVETGISDERRVEILWGLNPDDKVITGPFRALDELKDGSPVILGKATGESEGRS